jgi:hypothetical protein
VLTIGIAEQWVDERLKHRIISDDLDRPVTRIEGGMKLL